MKTTPLPVVLFAFLFAGSAFSETKVAAPATTGGYTCLFMGHSFFHPVATGMEALAHRAGFEKHRQLCIMSGGTTGTPGHFWSKGPKERKDRMIAYLETGDVDLVGFTYHPEGMCEVEDYARWVELALKHNPKTKFFIGLSWSRRPAQPIDEFEAGNRISRDILGKKIDALREQFPGKTFFLINYGTAVIELKRQYEAGKFPKIERLVNNKGQKGTHLFRDPLGHAGSLVIEMSRLVWLSAIYQTDLAEYDWQPHPDVNFKSIAARAVAAEPYSKFTSPKIPAGEK